MCFVNLVLTPFVRSRREWRRQVTQGRQPYRVIALGDDHRYYVGGRKGCINSSLCAVRSEVGQGNILLSAERGVRRGFRGWVSFRRAVSFRGCKVVGATSRRG